jgi:hypothetical protein
VTVFEDRHPDWDDDSPVVTWPSQAAVASDWWGHYVGNAEFQDHAPPVRDATPAEEAAQEFVDRLARSGDPRALPLLAVIAETAPDRDALFFLGAGPLEDLFQAHGDVLAPKLVEAATRSGRFKIALSGVWPDRDRPLSERAMAMLAPYLGDDETTPFD